MKIAIFVAALVLASFSMAFAHAEKVLTVNTIYPSPNGSYNELQLYPHDTPNVACNENTLGTLFYDSSVDKLKVCTRVGGAYMYVAFAPQMIAVTQQDNIDGALIDLPEYPDGSTPALEDCAISVTPKKCVGFHDAEGEEEGGAMKKYLHSFVTTNGFVVCKFSQEGEGAVYSGECRVNIICVQGSHKTSSPSPTDEIYCTGN